MDCNLSCAQLAGLEHTRKNAVNALKDAQSRIVAVLNRAGLDSSLLHIESLMTAVQACSRVAIHFHPDRLAADGCSVVQSMLRDGVYRSQFETRMSAKKHHLIGAQQLYPLYVSLMRK